MLSLLLSISLQLSPPDSSPRMLANYAASEPRLSWFVVNDNVMGGRSEGGFETEENALLFAGQTNTNGGGFSSIRTAALDLDLSEYAGLRLRVLGDGRRYTWRLTTSASWRRREVAYWADFETRKGQWIDVEVPFSRFVPRFRGAALEGPELDPGDLKGMGLMIYDGEDGPFMLQLQRIEAYRASP